MDYHQRNGDDNYSTLTFNQPLNSLSLTSSTISILDSTSKTTSLIMSKQSNINVDRTRSLRKRHYQLQKQIEHRISSNSTSTTTNISPSITTVTEKQEEPLKKFPKIQRQEARPLGTCVRKCGQCRQLKHILLAECTVCFRMMDVDLKDCKCQILTSRNIIEHFICSICNSELTLDGYIICANRTCQTILSALINKENNNEIQEKSSFSDTLTNICYPKSAHRTVAVQVNTLINLSPLQRFLSTIIDDENKVSSSSSWSKHDLNRIRITSSDSSHTSRLSIDSGVDASLNDIARNMTAGFNSNQPTKLALESEDELRQKQQSQIHNLTNTNETIVNNNPEFIPMPTSPRCLAIMNVRKRHDRLSTLITLQINKTCQTQLSCLTDIDEMIKFEELSNTTIIRTNNPTKIERQIQVDTIKGRFDDLCQVRIEIADRLEKDSTIDITNDERILQAITDKDGQRWSELIDQLINEQSQSSPSENAQQLLDTIERLHTTGQLNNLTTGQLQRKVRYAMSQFKHNDEQSYLQNNLKTTKNNRSGTNSRKNTECNGRMDMAVTVRQIDKGHNYQSVASSDQNWKPYVDRLFEQGHTANEIQRLLHEAAETTMQSDDQRLQDVFNYINIKANQQRAKTAPSGIMSVATAKETKSVERQEFQPTNLFQSNKPNEAMGGGGGIKARRSSSISERKVISNESSPAFNDKNQVPTTEVTKNKSSLPSNCLIQSHIIKSDIIKVEPSEKTSIIDLNEDEKERSLSMHSSSDQKHEDIMANPNATTIYKKQSIDSTEITIQRKTSNDKKLDSNNIAITLEQKTNQIQEVVESKISQVNETSSSHKRNSPITITPSNKSNDVPLTYLQEKCIHALQSVQNTLDIIDNADVRLRPYPSNIQSELNKLTNAFESYLHKSNNINRDNIEFLMTQCIEHLNNEKKAIVPQLEERHFRNLNEKISNTLNLLQEYKKMAMPIQTNNDDSSFNRHMSNMIMVQSDTPALLERVEENIEQIIESTSQPIQLPSNTTLDLKQQILTSEYQETASPIRCRPIPYTSSNEKRSTETLTQVLICSTEHISLKSKDLNEQLITNKSDLNYILDISSKTKHDLHNDQSQIIWLDSLLSKMSDNVSSTTDIFSASPSLSLINQTKIDRNDKQDEEEQKTQESIDMEIVDKQVPSLNNRSKSSIPIHQHTSNVPEIIRDSQQNTLYETDVIRLEEEHAMSIIIPDRDISMLDEQFQVVQTKILQNKSAISPKQVLNLEDQITPLHDEKNDDNIRRESSNLNHDSNDTSQKPLSVTTLHENNFDQEKQPTSSVVNDEPQLITIQSSSHSDVDLSQQLDQDTTSPEQLVADNTSASEEKFESPQEQFDRENEEKISPVLVPEHTALSKTDIDTTPEPSTESLPLNNQEEEGERTTAILPVPLDEIPAPNLMKTNELDRHIEKTPNSSQADTQVFDGHASIATSEIVNHQNDTNKFQLPVSTQHFSISNSIQSNSLLTHLNGQDDTISSKKSISSDNPTSNLHEHASKKISSIDSKDQNIVATPIQNSDDKISSSGNIDNTVNNEFYTPIMLSPNHSIAQQPANKVLSPSRTTKIENGKYKKLITPSSFPLEPTSSPTTHVSKEDQLIVKRDSAPRLFIEELSGSTTPLTETVITDNNNDDERSNKPMSNTQEVPIHDKPKEDLNTDLPVLSNASTQESNTFDDATHTLASPLRSTGSLTTSKTDDQQPKTQLTINRRFSRPKILIEDIQTPIILTPHSSVLSTTSGDETHMKSKQQLEKEAQLIPEDTETSNVSLSTTLDEENQLNKTPIESIVKEKSFSNENTLNTTLEHIATSEHSSTRYDKSEENPSVHSSFQSEQSHQDEDYQSKKENSLRMESLIKLLPSPPDQQSIEDDDSETKDTLDQIRRPYLIEHDDKNKDRLDDQKPYIGQHLSPVIPKSDTKRVEPSSSVIIKKRPVTSTVTVILPSSVTNVNTQEQKLKSQISSLERKNSKLTSDKTTGETKGSISISPFNLAHLTDLTSNNRHETEDKKLPSQSEKSVPDDNPHHINSKQQSSSTNSLIRGGIPSSSMPKLLLKRSSIKHTSTTSQSTKPNATLSITDVSTSSSNTIATDHLLSTHSTISDQEEIISLKKVNKRNNSKDRFMTTSNSVPKHNMLNKTFPSSNRKERHIEASKKKFINNSLLTNSDLTYDTEPGSEAWIKSREDISQILIIDEQDTKKPQIYERQSKKQHKNKIIDGSQLMPFYLKARSDHQAYTVDSSRLPSIEQSCGEHHMKKLSNGPFRRPIIRLPVTQIEKFECGTIGPYLHPSSLAHQLFPLPSIHDRSYLPSQFNEITESFTDRFYSLMSSENNDDKQAFESILNWQHQYHIPKIEENKFQYMYLLDTSIRNSVHGKQYPILTDEIDMIDDPNVCTIVNKWAFADLVNNERDKFIHESKDNINKSKKSNKNIKICLQKRPLTEFEQNVFKEVDIISIVDSQTMLLHIPSITVDNQVFIKNRKFKCDQTFDEHSQINTIYHSTLSPLLNIAIDRSKCLCLIGGGKYSGKTYLLRSLMDLFAFDLNRLLSTYDIYIKLLGICHNRIVDVLQNYTPIRLMKSMNWSLIPNDEFHIENEDDIDYIKCQIKKRRRFIHQLIEINFRQNNQSIGSLMIVVLASSQYVYTRNLCSHRRKFLINSLNKTILSFKRALLGIRQNPDRIRTAFNNDILTQLIQPYVFHQRSNICYIGTINPGHRHRIATKSTLEFARNLRFCLKRINKQRRQRKKFSRINSNNDNIL